MYHSAQLIKMSSVQTLQVRGKYPCGAFFCGHVDPPCRRFCSRWLFSGCHWLPRILHKHIVLFHLIRLEGFHYNAGEGEGGLSTRVGNTEEPTAVLPPSHNLPIPLPLPLSRLSNSRVSLPHLIYLFSCVRSACLPGNISKLQ